MQTLPEQVEVERTTLREYDQQLWNHIKRQHASAFASKTVLSIWYTHKYSCSHILFFSTLVGKSLIFIMIYSCSHVRIIREYSTIRAAGCNVRPSRVKRVY